MRRMYTTEGIQKIIDGSIDEAFETLEDRKGVFEKIADKNGNLRFIEGDGTPITLEGIENLYCHWALSGLHLMAVVFLHNTTAESITLPTNQALGVWNLPSWILNKIYGSLGNIVSWFSANDSSGQSIPLTIRKSSNDISINVDSNNKSLGAGEYIRIAVDLLIDNE